MFRCVLLISILLGASSSVAAAEPPVRVMVIGTFHWSNPNRDLHDEKVDDVLTPKRQAEIAWIAAALSRFRPTEIAVESDAPVVVSRYAQYLNGTLKPSRNEVVQLGFRLAKANNTAVHGIDVEGDFPYEAVEKYAKAHGQQAILAHADRLVVEDVAKEQAIIDSDTLSAALRRINDPLREDGRNAFNRLAMKIGHGSEQPGAELFAAWAKRNALICANLLQLSKPGDRVVVIFGAGHETFLRQCVRETPGFELIEANDYLPK